VIYSLQVYRGLAAVLVVLFHTHMIMPGYFKTTTLSELISFGYAGVQFFFVLSGYIIYKMHSCDAGKPARLPVYLFKRFIRIYPIYWIVTFSFLPFWLLIPSFGESYHREIPALIKSLILFPQEHAPHVQVGWTLVHEVFFYLSFATIIINRALGFIFLIVWVTIYATTSYLNTPLSFPANFFLSELNLIFLLGIAAASVGTRLAKHVDHTGFLVAFIFGNLLFLAFGLIDVFYLTDSKFSLFYGFSAFLIVIAAGNSKLESYCKKRRIILFLGDASYSIYLIHPMVLSFTAKLIIMLGLYKHLDNNVIFSILFISALVIGALLHSFIEKPLLQKLRSTVSSCRAN